MTEPLPFKQVVRLGVFEKATGKRVSTLSLDVVNSQINGSFPEGLEDAFKQAFLAFRANADEELEPQIMALLDLAAGGLGLSIRPVAANDQVINAQWDFATGMVVGRSQTFDGAEALPPAVLKRISDSISGAMERISNEIADRILSRIDNPEEAALEAMSSDAMSIEPSQKLGTALKSVDAAALQGKLAKDFLTGRAAVLCRLRRWSSAAVDAEMVLARFSDHDTVIAIELRNLIAIGHKHSNRTEAAISIWSQLVYETAGVAASSRAQMLRNLAFSVPRSDQRALEWMAQSVDAYLQAGERREAAVSTVYWGDFLEHHDGTKAFAMLDMAEELLDDESPIGDALRAALHYTRAHRLIALGRKPEALASAIASADLRRGLIGQEDDRLSSLALCEDLAVALSDSRASDFAAEKEAFLAEIPNPRFLLGTKVTAILADWDVELAEEIRAIAQTVRPSERMAAEIALVTKDPALDDNGRLAALEGLYDTAQRKRIDNGVLTSIRLGIAAQLRAQSAMDRAAQWLELILVDNPLAENVADLLIDTRKQMRDWSAAATVARREITLKGENFDRLIVLAETTGEAGLHTEAAGAALRAKALAPSNEDRSLCDSILAQAIAGGGSLPAASVAPAIAPVTTGELETVLREFSKKVSSDYRMDYWVRNENDDYEWVASPERRAQIQLRTWLDGSFRGRVTVLEEIDAGAGRMDVLLQLAGGNQAILELKMCGFRYSSTYAAAGVDQILHYMEQKDVNLGYLVVFDARLRDCGTPLMAADAVGGATVREISVDVRPRGEKGRKPR